jgi:DNA-binding MurR/RpiR family transcriptional regulator
LDQRDKLFHNIDQDSQSRNILHYSISKDIKTMTTGLETVDLEKFEQAAAIIASAAKLYIMGLGISKSLASFLEFRLRRVGMQIRTLVNGGQEFIENLLSLRAGDAILAIGFQRSYKEISVALEYARKLGVSTVALVENPLSPLARKSDISLNIKRGPTEELNSLAFPMSVCNALALRVAYEKKEQAIAASKDLDWLNQKLAAATQNPEFPE